MSYTKSQTVHVIAPARLHLGFLDLNGSLGRKYGSIGLAINEPKTDLLVSKAENFSSLGIDKERALNILQTSSALFSDKQAYKIQINEAIPAHAGLGSGTQLALAIRTAVLKLSAREKEAKSFQFPVERGERSGIGIASFKEGGFIIDGGRGSNEIAPQTIARLLFPENWRIILVMDPKKSGVYGEVEKNAFRSLPPYSEITAGHLSRLTLMKLLPSLVEQDLQNFGSALTEIQSIVGEHFSPAQGGTPWSSLSVGKIIKKLGELGAKGLGQTSWGPTGFVFVANDAEAEDLYSSTKEEARSLGLEMKIVRARNTGASIDVR